MTDSAAWRAHLRAPRPRDHIVQLHTDEAFLVRGVTEFVGGALGAGEGALLVTTPLHAEAIDGRLADTGHDPRAARSRGQLLVLPAEPSLRRFMRAGMPDADAFRAVVREPFRALRAKGFHTIRVYGEMADLLWARHPDATLRLEELWNEVLADEQASLLCSYRADSFAASAPRGLLHRVASSHSHLIPVDDYERLDRAVARACDEVFGSGEDGARVHGLLSSWRRSTVMPPPQAALLALRGLPDSIAESVLARARYHYRS